MLQTEGETDERSPIITKRIPHMKLSDARVEKIFAYYYSVLTYICVLTERLWVIAIACVNLSTTLHAVQLIYMLLRSSHAAPDTLGRVPKLLNSLQSFQPKFPTHLSSPLGSQNVSLNLLCLILEQ
jgi:hypothetical protein